MEHREHVALIREGARGAGRRWLELGAGDGAFTLALADVLGPGASLVALDRDTGALSRLAAAARRVFPETRLETVAGDFTWKLPDGPFDGVLAANSLHFVREPAPLLEAIHGAIAPGGRLLVVEYDTDRGNRWVPYPFSFGRWQVMATGAGFADIRLVGRVPSRFLGAMYAAAAIRAGND